MKENNEIFNKWRKRANSSMPDIAMRVFNLRKEFYIGCGFHYDLEKLLGYCLRELNNYTEYPEWWAQEFIKLAVSDLFRQVSKIENELEHKGL